MDDGAGRHTDGEAHGLLAVELVRDLYLRRFAAVDDFVASEVLVVDLEEQVILVVAEGQDPLEALAFQDYGGEADGPLSQGGRGEHVIAAFMDDHVGLAGPAAALDPIVGAKN